MGQYRQGRHLHASTLWLAEELAKLPPDVPVTSLYRAWRSQYAALIGLPLADPRRSFRNAVKNARRRLQGQSGT